MDEVLSGRRFMKDLQAMANKAGQPVYALIAPSGEITVTSDREKLKAWPHTFAIVQPQRARPLGFGQAKAS